MNTKEKIEVMQAFEDGKDIQFRVIANGPSAEWNEWIDPRVPHWDFSSFEYRIKPKLDDMVGPQSSFVPQNLDSINELEVAVAQLKEKQNLLFEYMTPTLKNIADLEGKIEAARARTEYVYSKLHDHKDGHK